MSDTLQPTPVPELTRSLTDQIKRTAENLADLLWQAHQGQAWKALNYASWKTYCESEFQRSEAHVYRLLDFVKIKSELSDPALPGESPPAISPANEKQIRSLKKITDRAERKAVWDEAVAAANGGQPTARQVEEVIEKRAKAKAAAAEPKPKIVEEAAVEPDPKPAPAPAPMVYTIAVTYSVVAATVKEARALVADQLPAEATVTSHGEAYISPDMLSMTAQKKLELAIKQGAQKLAAEFDTLVYTRAKELLVNALGPSHQKQLDEAKAIIKARKGVMTKKTYRKIWSCLHPDWVTDPEKKERSAEAFRDFSKMEKLLLNEESSPTEFCAPLPKTREEWEERKRQVTAERKAKRAASRAARGGIQPKQS